MVLVDTSVWIDHFCRGNTVLTGLLDDIEVVTHPYIIGELACGNIRNRSIVLDLLQALPSLGEISRNEYLLFIERHSLYGKGLGFVDIHLVGSAYLHRCPLFTLDKRLRSAAQSFGLIYR